MSTSYEFDPELNKELDTLRESLQTARDTLINDWTAHKFITEMEAASAAICNEGETENAALLGKIENCKVALTNKEIIAAVHVEEQMALKQKLEHVSKTTDAILHEKEQLGKELVKQKDENVKQLKLISGQAEVTASRRQELEKSACFFKVRLGLQFKKISGGRLQVVFTCIDPSDLDRVFYFSVKINSDGTYTVMDVEPTVPDLDHLIAELNKTNDFRRFVHSMRSKFKATI